VYSILVFLTFRGRNKACRWTTDPPPPPFFYISLFLLLRVSHLPFPNLFVSSQRLRPSAVSSWSPVRVFDRTASTPLSTQLLFWRTHFSTHRDVLFLIPPVRVCLAMLGASLSIQQFVDDSHFYLPNFDARLPKSSSFSLLFFRM